MKRDRRFIWGASLIGVAGILATLIGGCAGTGAGGGGGAAGLPWSSGGLKIGYVRSDQIVQKYPDYKDVDNQLRSENEEWLVEAERMASDIVKKESEIEELRLILSSEEKQKRDDELTQARKDLQKFRQETWYDESSRYIRRRNELMEPVNARVNDAIWRVAQDKGLDVVFDTVSGNLVYVKPAYDLTELVLEELKK